MEINSQKGFAAAIAVILFSSGLLVMSLANLAAVLEFFDSVNKKEARIQAGLNLKSCLETAGLILVKDRFAKGQIEVRELGCRLTIENDFHGPINVLVSVDFAGVTLSSDQTFDLAD